MTEKVTDQDEVKTLGYFETVKSTFLLKVLLLWSHLDPGLTHLVPESFLADQIKAFEGAFPGGTIFSSLRARSDALVPNLRDDIGTSALVGSWMVFELIIKDRTHKDYALNSVELAADFRHNMFGLSDREKRDLELFYYLRNALVHYNGAYYSSKSINHAFAGQHFVSTGHEGEKIELSLEIAWKIVLRIEELAMKAWNNSEIRKGGGQLKT